MAGEEIEMGKNRTVLQELEHERLMEEAGYAPVKIARSLAALECACGKIGTTLDGSLAELQEIRKA